MNTKSLTPALILSLMLSLPVAAEEKALISIQVLTPDAALALAKATLQACRDKGFQVAVAVVDRMGVPQVMLRDRYAGAHTPSTATRKAWTATSFRTNTRTMVEETQAGKMQSGIRFVENALMLGGGVLVEANGSIVGAVGVSGSPTGENDDACAKAGIAAIEDKLLF